MKRSALEVGGLIAMLDFLAAAKRLSAVGGVIEVDTNAASTAARVPYDETRANVDTIRQAIEACSLHCKGESVPCHLSIPYSTGLAPSLARALLEVTKLDLIVFDKTGTLTMGQPRIVEIASANGTTLDDAFRGAAAVERESDNPLALASSSGPEIWKIRRITRPGESAPGVSTESEPSEHLHRGGRRHDGWS